MLELFFHSCCCCWECTLELLGLLQLLHLRLRLLLLLHLHLPLSDCLQLLLLAQSLLHNSQQLRRLQGFVSLSEQ